jgi:cbb3-type cytochrome oxidase cytochrome c subunit
MREIFARMVCLLTVSVVVALAHVFAAWHNPHDNPPTLAAVAPMASAPAPSAPEIQGRKVYDEQGCASCHAIAGEGNPRHPLDGVGSRRSVAELREWITGSGLAAEDLAPSVVRRKQRYRELAPTEMDALVAYLGSLKSER